jgi:hypothetical protein
MSAHEDTARRLAEAFGVEPGQVFVLHDEVDEMLGSPATDGGPGTVRDQLHRFVGMTMDEAEGRSRLLPREEPEVLGYGQRDYSWPPEPAASQRPVCQAIRPHWGRPVPEPCGCGLVKRYRLGCKNEHVAEEWLCTCCADASERTCCHPVTGPGTEVPVTCGEALTAVPVEDLGPSAGDVPPSVQRTRGRAAGPGDGENWFRGPGE